MVVELGDSAGQSAAPAADAIDRDAAEDGGVVTERRPRVSSAYHSEPPNRDDAAAAGYPRSLAFGFASEPLKSYAAVLPTVDRRAIRETGTFGRRLRSASSIDDVLADGQTPSSGSRRIFNASCFTPERVGTDICRRYEICPTEIGSGGNGKVFIARDRVFKNREVAIKRLRSRSATDEVMRREIEIMKRLDHPSICKLFETYEQVHMNGSIMCFVIEHLEGGDLAGRLQEDAIEERTAAYIIKQVASALRYAHSQGIAHRDMKPENVCFCSGDRSKHRVKVIDWGLSKHFADQRMKTPVGTEEYCAPEVLKAAHYTSACDLWSLGVMTYMALIRKFPFWGGLTQMVARMQEERYPRSSEAWDGISEHGRDFITRLIRFVPENRLPTEQLLQHPWLSPLFVEASPEDVAQVLTNVEGFSHAPDFLAMCVSSAARQLDHRSLDSIYRVFTVLDTNGDGLLQPDEVKVGLEQVFGVDSREVEEAHDMFTRIDFDGTGVLHYSEFCAAAIGESRYTQEHVLWAAFKTFDVADRGRISLDEMRQVLSKAEVSQVWSQGVCEDVAAGGRDVCESEDMGPFGSEDGSIEFEEWLHLMRESAARLCEDVEAVRERRRRFSIGDASGRGTADRPEECSPEHGRRLIRMATAPAKVPSSPSITAAILSETVSAKPSDAVGPASAPC